MGLFKRCVFQFKHKDVERSWNEGFYYGNGESTLDTVKEAAASLLKLRVAMLSRGVTIHNAYVSDDDFVRDTLPVPMPSPMSDGTWNKTLEPDDVTSDSADFPWVTLLLRMRSGVRTTKSCFLSGLPDVGTTTPTANRVKSGAFNKALEAWEKALKGTWAWKGVQTSVGVNPQRVITNAVEVGGVITVTTEANHGFSEFEEVNFNKVKALTGKLKGTYRVQSVTTDKKFTVNRKGADAFTWQREGLVQKRSMGLLAIEEVIVRGIADKKRGNSIGQHRGRRKTRTS